MTTERALSVNLKEVKSKITALRNERKQRKEDLLRLTAEISRLRVTAAWYSWVSEVIAELGSDWKILEDASEVEVYDDNEGSAINGEITLYPAADVDPAEVVLCLHEGIGVALVYWTCPSYGDATLFCPAAAGLVEMINKTTAKAQAAAKEALSNTKES